VNAYIYIEHQGDMQQSDNVTEMVLNDDVFSVQASDHGIELLDRNPALKACACRMLSIFVFVMEPFIQ